MLQFTKYQGAGNDFIIIDNRKGIFRKENFDLVKKLCDRRFGIGADGLMLLEKHADMDFEMVYFNSDGFPGSMCGNGGRCIAAYAHEIGLINGSTNFMAVDGVHEAIITKADYIKLKMSDVTEVKKGEGYYFLNTGSPHYVTFVENLDKLDVFGEGRTIRNSDAFKPGGTNVNFVSFEGQGIAVRTYERGVENETMACGTGITASALVASIVENSGKSCYPVRAMGGNLEVRFKKNGSRFSDIWLEGPAVKVFEGELTI